MPGDAGGTSARPADPSPPPAAGTSAPRADTQAADGPDPTQAADASAPPDRPQGVAPPDRRVAEASPQGARSAHTGQAHARVGDRVTTAADAASVALPGQATAAPIAAAIPMPQTPAQPVAPADGTADGDGATEAPAVGTGAGGPGLHAPSRAAVPAQGSRGPDAKASGLPADAQPPTDPLEALQPIMSAPGSPDATAAAAAAVPAGLAQLPLAAMQAGMAMHSGGAAAASATSTAPPEVQQTAPAIVSLASTKDGASSLTVSLNPRELGAVQVQLVRAQDGSTSLTVTADRAQTLEQLTRNAHHLHEALDAANIPTDHRTLAFALSPSADDGSGTAGRGNPQGSGGGQNSPQRQPAWESRDGASRNSAAGSATAGSASPATIARRWIASGLNITA
ncbi:flagellar hook-length control protein FliK [Lichenicoccus sp.]|uniref:flagellar hook-length control protein FliK n=1 Tax=Lichenicoccus sp. TaxID=2781899 RepID=UPI003D0A1407